MRLMATRREGLLITSLVERKNTYKRQYSGFQQAREEWRRGMSAARGVNERKEQVDCNRWNQRTVDGTKGDSWGSLGHRGCLPYPQMYWVVGWRSVI
jgi:hypothetical protein